MRAILIILLLLPVVYALPQLGVDDVMIYQAYPEHDVLAWSSLPTGTDYEWYVDNALVDQGQTDTLLLLHFDNSLEGAAGELPVSVDQETYEPGLFGLAFRGKAYYDVSENLDLDVGTIDIWITFLEPFDSPVYDASVGGDPYFLRHRNSDLNELFYFFVKSSANLTGFVAYNGSWPDSVQLSTSRTYVDLTVPHLLTVSFNLSNESSPP